MTGPPASHLVLPNLVLAGVTKAGTTSLFHYLGQHPEVLRADVKELDHYAPLVEGREPPPLDEYSRHFAAWNGQSWRLDASPRYFIGGDHLVRRLRTELPEARVLVILRDPTARMWSSYTYKRSKNRLPPDMGFSEFYDQCLRVWSTQRLREPSEVTYRALGTGVYPEHLPPWLESFGEHAKVLFFEDLVRSPHQVMTDLCAWLGLDAAPVQSFDLEQRNKTVQPRSAVLRRLSLGADRLLFAGRPAGSAVRKLARAGYDLANSGRARDVLSAADRERVRLFYLPTLGPLRAVLERHEQHGGPAWLTGTDAVS